MFNSKTKENRNSKSFQQSVISKDTSLIGDIETDGSIRIDGSIEGSIITKNKIVIGKDGMVKGSINGRNANIEGRFFGKISLTGTLSLMATAHIEGQVQTNKLVVEPGANFNGSCGMGGTVKNLKETPKQLPNSGKRKTEQTA